MTSHLRPAQTCLTSLPHIKTLRAVFPGLLNRPHLPVLPVVQAQQLAVRGEALSLHDKHFAAPPGGSYHSSTMKLLTKEEEAAHYSCVYHIL